MARRKKWVDDGMEQEGFIPEEPIEDSYPAPNPEEPMDDALLERHSIFRPRLRKPNFVLTVAVNVIRVMAVMLILAVFAGTGVLAGIAKGYVETAPTLNTQVMNEQDQTSFIYDANLNLITEYKGTENRVMVSLAAMPRDLQHAFVAVEDARFYDHNGVDIKRIGGALISNLSGNATQGGSTITQQLIKNTLLSSEQSYKRKIQEAYLSIQLEQTLTQTHYSQLLREYALDESTLAANAVEALQAEAKRLAKDEILENYMNTIWLGESYYGVEVAAQGFFGKELRDLTLRECAVLAGMANSPYYYNPRRNYYTRGETPEEQARYRSITDDRTDYVLRRMMENGYITENEYEAALNPATASILQSDPTAGAGMYPYAHYVEYAVSEVVDIFLELNGLEDTSANRAAMENKFRTGGYRVQLALEPSIQEAVQSTLSAWSDYPSLRDPSDKILRVSNGDGTYTEVIQPQAAAAVVDYRTGEIKAIVGSRDAPTVRKSLNRAVNMRMPVGSAIKPLTVYAPALESGLSPASITYNMALPISGWLDEHRQDSWPKNYGGGGYTGPITLREAMRKSYNTAAARIMMSRVGVGAAVDYLHRMGVDDNHIDATPFGVTLGSSGITPLQMSVAFGTLANGGTYIEPISVLGISDSEGNVIWDGHANQERRRVFSTSTAYMVVDMMKDVVKSGTGTSAKISGQTVAGKTGTNSDQRGVTFAGFTGYYASCVWVGHDNYKPLSSKTTGSQAAAPLWQAYMAKIHKGLSNRDIMDGDPSQYGLVRVETCKVSGQLATDACRADGEYGTTTDLWRSGTQPTVSCQMHTSVQVCAESGMPASAYCPNVITRSGITIPVGHPLYQFLGTKYESEITKYLTLSTASTGQVCTLHSAYTQTDPYDPYNGGYTAPQASAYAGDARALIAQAQAMLSGLDPNSVQAIALNGAISNLQYCLDAGADDATLLNAMGQLTQAMAGIF
ncbi:MAG: transglycosylase domain-containing protein [Clostridia bacterium]|nr:transglycosylase domain-containing protein [Clostridia bacterium]